jgi:hypothetical protein
LQTLIQGKSGQQDARRVNKVKDIDARHLVHVD